MVLVCKHLVVVGLAPPASSRPFRDAGVHNDVVVARLAVAHVILAAAKDHQVPSVVVVLGAVVVVNRLWGRGKREHNVER